jgi:hypothetical protein
MKTAELTGAELDFWVARAEGLPAEKLPGNYRGLAKYGLANGGDFVRYGIGFGRIGHYSTDWRHGGPIYEKLDCTMDVDEEAIPDHRVWCVVYVPEFGKPFGCHAPTKLIAGMRAFVASKFGDEVQDL